MITKAYIVMSLAQINRLAKVAKRHKRASQGRRSHCVILHLEITDQFSKDDPDGEQQIQSSSFAWAISLLEKDAELAERVNQIVAETPALNK
jgi:hypothetical protein